MREAQFLAPLECEEGLDVEIIRFSKSFMCKATGALVEADTTFHRADASAVGVTTTPVSFQTDPPTAITYNADGTTVHYPFFTLTLTASQAPESCETLYWDPILASITFDDGVAASVLEVAEPEPVTVRLWILGPILGGVAALLFMGVAAVMCYRKRNGRSTRVKSSTTV